jgi:hypothetical protein
MAPLHLQSSLRNFCVQSSCVGVKLMEMYMAYHCLQQIFVSKSQFQTRNDQIHREYMR